MEVMMCPNCRYLFCHRRNRKCPECSIDLIYKNERISCESNGYILIKNNWIKIRDDNNAIH